MTDDLKADLAKVGGGDVQLAASSTPKLEIVSATERNKSNAPTPKAGTGAKAISQAHGTKAAIPSALRETPTVIQTNDPKADVTPVQTPQAAPPILREPSPATQGRPSMPKPSTQREPPGGWRRPSDVIRNAPFPINP